MIYADTSYLTNGYLDTVIDWVPGMKNIRLKDLPTFFQVTDPNDEIFNLAMESAESSCKGATAFCVQTFDALEPHVLGALSSMYPNVYTIGPLQLLLNNQSTEEDQLKSLSYNLWKEEPECLQWLDSMEPGSVVYVNFGSVTVTSMHQLVQNCNSLNLSFFYMVSFFFF